MRFFVGVNLELAEVSKEMALRTRQRELRRAVMRFHEEDSSSIKALLTAIEQEAKSGRKGSGRLVCFSHIDVPTKQRTVRNSPAGNSGDLRQNGRGRIPET